MCTEKMRSVSYIGAEEITFPPKSDRRTEISNYRVASLLKRNTVKLNKYELHTMKG